MNNRKRIVHICSFDKFIKSFVEFNEAHCSEFEHEYFIIGYHSKYQLPAVGDFKVISAGLLGKLTYLLELSGTLKSANQIIVHGLFDTKLLMFLFTHTKFLHKTYWVMWGADLYVPVEKTFKQKFISKLRSFVCSRFGGVITYLQGDYVYAKERWNVKGRLLECIAYPSNIFKERLDGHSSKIFANDNKALSILVGNSADPSNNHFEIIDKLVTRIDKIEKVYAPLSYGNEANGELVIARGKAVLQEKFVPLTEFMPLNEYLSLLENVDIAIFNHKRQQAMGNTINLIGLGKTVYLRSDVTQWEFLKSLGLYILDVEQFDGTLLTPEQVERNKTIVKSYFSPENYRKQLLELYSV